MKYKAEKLLQEEYAAFIYRNRIQVNRYFTIVLCFFIAAGAAIALGIKVGIFRDVTYETCIVISVAMLFLSFLHYLMTKWKPGSRATSVVALVALDGLVSYMNCNHVDSNLAWFLVPFLSIFLYEKAAYAGISLFNFVLMIVSTYFATAHDFAFRKDFETPLQYFIAKAGGLAIEAVILFVSGYLLTSLIVRHFKALMQQEKLVRQKEAETEEKTVLLDSMAEIYDYVNLISFIDNTEMTLRDKAHGGVANMRHGIDVRQQTHTLINQRMQRSIVPEQLEDFLQFTNIKTVRSRLSQKKIISADFLDAAAGWFRAQYITVDTALDGIPNVVIYTIRNVDEEKRREERLLMVTMTDELTGLPNRRCYEGDLAEYRLHELKEDFVLLAIDVNGLKKVNDSQGHAGGDELIKGAANCLTLSVGKSGKVYRTGGDEFMAIVHAKNPQALCEEIGRRSGDWHGVYSGEMSMSIGYASHAGNETLTVDELAKEADAQMYAAKERYYKEKGIERRRG